MSSWSVTLKDALLNTCFFAIDAYKPLSELLKFALAIAEQKKNK
jgi:hypothetical protein